MTTLNAALCAAIARVQRAQADRNAIEAEARSGLIVTAEQDDD